MKLSNKKGKCKKAEVVPSSQEDGEEDASLSGVNIFAKQNKIGDVLGEKNNARDISIRFVDISYGSTVC